MLVFSLVHSLNEKRHVYNGDVRERELRPDVSMTPRPITLPHVLSMEP